MELFEVKKVLIPKVDNTEVDVISKELKLECIIEGEYKKPQFLSVRDLNCINVLIHHYEYLCVIVYMFLFEGNDEELMMALLKKIVVSIESGLEKSTRNDLINLKTILKRYRLTPREKEVTHLW